jgi:hypothetical protein
MRITCNSIEPETVDGVSYLILRCSRNVLHEELKELHALGGSLLGNLEALLRGTLKLAEPEGYPASPLLVSWEGIPLTLVAEKIDIARCSHGIDLRSWA